jgi:hypothetical protein
MTPAVLDGPGGKETIACRLFAGGDNFDPDWQLDAGHYFDAEAADEGFSLYVVYPRPDVETNSYARHRWAFPGILFEVPMGVQFGSWPYWYTKVSGPSWLDIVYETLMPVGDHKEPLEGYGVLSGIAPATPQDAENVVVRVTDQTGATVDITFSVEVSADPFVFLDPVNGDDGTADGTIDLPFKEVSALQDADLGETICYIRAAADYTPDPPRQFRVATADEPRAYVGYPGEEVVINCTNDTGFSGGSNDDTFFDNLTIVNVNRTNEDASNVRAIARFSQVERETLWRLTCKNMFAGTASTDNSGFAIYLALSGTTDDPTPGHWHLYMADCVGDELNPEGTGSNGAAMWQAYMARRSLIERNTVTNSQVINNGLFFTKESEKYVEFRWNNAVDGNVGGNYQLRTLCSSNRGFPKWNLFRHNFSGSSYGGRIGTAGAMDNRDSVDHGPIIFARNNFGTNGLSSLPTAPTPYDGDYRAHDNVAGSLSENYPTASGNVIDSVGNLFDADMKLTGSARTTNLGTKGAEVA